MTSYKRGDVVLVAFPFTDLSASKVRPALVVSSDYFHRSGLDVIPVGITSQTGKGKSETDFLLSIEDQRHAGLPKRSLVRLGKIFTLDCRLVSKKLGHIPDPTLSQLTSILHQTLSQETHPPSGSAFQVQERPAVYRARKPKARGRKRK
jgi:mRNA interferase MazF